MSEANEESLRRAVTAFNDPSGRDRYLDLYAPDFPDALLSLEETIASDDRVAARYTFTGIQAQEGVSRRHRHDQGQLGLN